MSDDFKRGSRPTGTGNHRSSDRGTSNYRPTSGSGDQTSSYHSVRGSRGQTTSFRAPSEVSASHEAMNRYQEMQENPQPSSSERATLSRSTKSQASRSMGRNRKSNNSNNKFDWRKYVNWKTILGSVGALVLIGVIWLTYAVMTVKEYDINALKKQDNPSVVLSGDTPISKIGETKQEFIPLATLKKTNPMLVETLVKVEDARFYEHDGVDVQGLARAVWNNVKSPGNGGGGGTLAMQVARNLILKDRTKTANRKITEMVVAKQLVEQYKKEGILENYLNYIYFGTKTKGVQMAAKEYFGKDLNKDTLTPDEVAILVAIPNNPSYFNPKKPSKLPNLKERRDWILKKKMTDSEYTKPLITAEQAEKFATVDITQTIVSEENNKYASEIKKGSHAAYLDAVTEELENRYGITEAQLAKNGFKIKVAIDTKMNETVENALKDEDLYKNKNGKKFELVNGAFTVVDRHTGRVLAVGGGKDYNSGSYNWALQKQQPGSSIKPIAVYGPYVEKNKDNNPDVNEYTPVKASKFSYRGWNPKDFHGEGVEGAVPLEKAIATSSNQAAARVLVEQVTLDRAKATLTKMGLPFVENKDFEAAFSLGGFTKGFSPIEMAQAYSVFPNAGSYVPAHTVLQVVDREGAEKKPLSGKEIDEQKANPVFSKKTSWYMTRMLQGVVESPYGTGKSAKVPGHDVGGKTGTTQGEKQGWFVGFTADYVGAAVLFNETRDGKQGKENITGGNAAKAWGIIMKQVLADKPGSHFQKPEGVPDPVRPFQLAPFEFSAELIEGQGVKINIMGSPEVNDPRIQYTVSRMINGQYQQVAQGNAGGLMDNQPIDPNNPVVKYKVVASIPTDPNSVPIEKERTVTLKVGPPQPDCNLNPNDPSCQPQPCPPDQPDCNTNQPDPNNPGNPDGQQPGPTEPGDCLKPKNRNTPYCQNIKQECQQDPFKYPGICPFLK